MSQDTLRGLQHELETIQQSLKGMSPVVQVIGLAPSLVENILPVLFPSITFVSGVDSFDCVGVHATLTVGSGHKSDFPQGGSGQGLISPVQCYTTWNLRLGEQPASDPQSIKDIVPDAIQWLIQHRAELF